MSRCPWRRARDFWMDLPEGVRAMIVVLAVIVVGLVALPARASEQTASSGGDRITLTDRPCTQADVVKRLQPGVLDKFHAARARINGEEFAGCWTEYGDAAFVMYEDGDKGLVPLADFKPDGA